MNNIVRDSDVVELTGPPFFSYGEKVRARRTIRNDGTYAGKDIGDKESLMTRLVFESVPDEEGHDVAWSAIPLSDPDITTEEIAAVEAVLRSPTISGGSVVEAFEAAFADYLGRKYVVAVPGGTLGLLIVLAAYGIGEGDEVIASSYSFPPLPVSTLIIVSGFTRPEFLVEVEVTAAKAG